MQFPSPITRFWPSLPDLPNCFSFPGFFPVLSTGGPLANVVGLPLSPHLRMDPYFAEEDLFVSGHSSTAPILQRNVTVATGETAFMQCTVRNLGAKKVRGRGNGEGEKEEIKGGKRDFGLVPLQR